VKDERLFIKRIQQFLQKHFKTEEEIPLTRKGKHTVNELFTFQINSKPFVIKIMTRPPRLKSDFYRFEKEAELLKYFSMENTQDINSSKGTLAVPVPEVFHVESNTEVIGFKFIIMNEVEGVCLKDYWEVLSLKEKTAIVRTLAGIFHTLHSRSFEMFGELEEYDCPRRFFSFQSYLKANLRRDILLLGKQQFFPVKLLTTVQLFFEKNLKKARFSETPRLVHSDLNLQNIIISREEKTKVKALLDFEWAYAGDPLFDLFSIVDEWLHDKVLKGVFFEAYSPSEDFSLDEYALEYRLYRIFSLIESTAIGWVHFHPTKEKLSHIEEKLSELIK